jgi:hypothetical protein
VIAQFFLSPTQDAIVQRLGQAYNALGLYFMARMVIQDIDDIEILLRAFSVIIIPLCILMAVEHTTGKNLFSVFGGVLLESQLRGGQVRCQGSFAHPILAGTFAATAFPLLLSLQWDNGVNRPFVLCGGLASAAMVLLARSSGPLVAFLCALIGLFVWAARAQIRALRWCLLLLLVFFHLVMKAPVWFLFARLSSLFGGSGWHRAELIDQTINHFSEWWLVGTNYTAHWMDAPNPSNPNMIDITNWFVGQAVNGGLVTLLLFTLIIVLGFRKIGLALRTAGNDPGHGRLIWGLGVALMAHTISFTSVVYFDQIVVFWYMLLAMIACPTLSQDREEIITTSDILA